MTLTALSTPTILDTSSSDLMADFFIPALRHAVRYDRGVGYFSSGWLRMTARGMVQFAANGGRARWVTSPILSAADWEALETGSQARQDEGLYTILNQNIANLAVALEKETLSALAWMVADEILDFRLAIPVQRLAGGDFHDKFGIFTDLDDNQIAFNGSYNESVQGTRNYESIKIFRSWEPAFQPLVQADQARFERLWRNEDPNLQVYALTDAARAQILQLRTQERPYPEPAWVKVRALQQRSVTYTLPYPRLPAELQLRDYQEEAIAAWFAHDCRGLLEMATGTGKTKTALACAARLFAREKRLAIIITVPYQHLVDQWQEECADFNFRPILAYQSKASWLDDLNHEILDYNGSYRNFIAVLYDFCQP